LRSHPKFLVPDKKFGPDRPGAVVQRLDHRKTARKFRSHESDGTFSQPDDLFLRGPVNGRQMFVRPPAMREFQHPKFHDSVWSHDGKTGADLDIPCGRYIHNLFLAKSGTGSTPSSKTFQNLCVKQIRATTGSRLQPMPENLCGGISSTGLNDRIVRWN
jgi:hypothetical protein